MARKPSSDVPLKLSPVGPNQRILLAVIVGVLVTWPLRAALPFPYPIAIGWIVGVTVFLGSTGVILSKATPDRMRARARKQDPLRPLLFSVVIAAAAISFVALGFMLGKDASGHVAIGLRILVAGLAVLASWTLTHTIFALHYAHLYYGDNPLQKGEQDRGGLKFPEEGTPDFWDFLYYAFVVGMTCQVSDVQVTSRHMRRLTLGHGVLAFLFNAVILALAVNFIAGAV